jgi:hypothetical protein
MSLAQELAHETTRREWQAFVDRYERRPHEPRAYDDREVLARYETVALEIPPGDFAEAAARVLRRMTLEERHDFLRDLERQAELRHIPVPIGGSGYAAQRDSRPQQLAEILTGLHQQEPGLLAAIFSGRRASRARFGCPASKLALAGIAALSLRRMLNRHSPRTAPSTGDIAKQRTATGRRRPLGGRASAAASRGTRRR